MSSPLLLPASLAGVAAGILLQDVAGTRSPGVALVGGGLLVGALAWVVARVSRPSPILVLAAAAMLAAGVGAWRGEAAALPTGPDSVSARVGETIWTVTGTILDDPRPRGERQQAVVGEIQLSDGRETPLPARGRLLVWLPRSAALQPGDRIRFDARLAEPRDFDGFAYRAYLARQGIGATAGARAVEIVDHELGPVAEITARLRRALLRGLNSLVPEPEAALAAGILLGVRSAIAPEVSDAFATAGLTHVVAISGWNIAIVATIAAGLCRPLLRRRGGRAGAAGLAAVTVGAYVLLTGASPSVVRAALMAGGLVLARFGGSRAHALSALMAAALAMLLAAPAVLWDVGFQLSALATAGLIWFGAPIEARLRRWPALVREPVALTMAAQLTTLPVILLNFERLSLVAPLANVLVVPLVPIVMLVAAIAALTGVVLPILPLAPLADLLGWAAGGTAWLYLRLMIGIGQLTAAIPFASVAVSAPPWLAVAWYPGLPLFRRWLGSHDQPAGAATVAGVERPVPAIARLARPLPVLAGTVALLALLTATTRPDGRVHLAVLDIGQGDAILLRGASGRTMLVDGGPDPDLLVRRLAEELPFWQRTVDVVVLTHPHEDHVAGLLPVLDRFTVRLVLDSGRAYPNPSYARFVEAAANEPGGGILAARAGLLVALDASTTMTVLFPDARDVAAPLPDGDINNASVVLLVEAGGRRILLSGDAEAPVERLLLERRLLTPVDLLKVGHHGSDSSTTVAFLAAIHPSLALISAGVDNEYGHPHQATLEHLAAVPGLVVRRTDLDGTIHVDWGAGAGRPSAPAGTIAAWPSPPASRQRRSLRATRCRRGSSPTRAAWVASPRRPRDSWPQPGCRSTWTSSRAPPCSTTSTSWRRGRAGSHTASSRRAG